MFEISDEIKRDWEISRCGLTPIFNGVIAVVSLLMAVALFVFASGWWAYVSWIFVALAGYCVFVAVRSVHRRRKYLSQAYLRG